MRFSQDFIQTVQEASNIVDVIGQYVTLRRTGGNHMGLCPFHNERSPSFSVSEDKQVYHCFGCKKAGGVFTFVQDYQGLTFPEAVEYLATRASLSLPAPTHDEGPSRDNKAALYRVNAVAAEYYHQELLKLPAEHPARVYVAGRGLDDELIRKYKLGYAGEQWEGLVTHLNQQRAPVAAAEQVGLIKRRTGGKSGHYDWFRERVMFPIVSPTEQYLGFGGRILTKENLAKYVNSAESAIFHKGRVFYGLNHAVRFIRTEDEVIVVEGYMDWLALAKASVNNVVATLGTALTADHARAIKRYTNRVLLLFDGDDAGRAAARRSLPILLAAGLHARGLFLPGNQDPDDYLKTAGVVELRKLVASAPDLFDLISTGEWIAAKGSPSAKVQLLDEFGPMLAQTADPRLRRLYAQNLANLLDVAVRLVEQTVAQANDPKSGRGTSSPVKPPVPTAAETSPQPVETPKFDLTKVPRAELDILNLILAREAHLKEALEIGIGSQFSHPGARGAFERIAEAYRLGPSKFDSLSALLANEVRPAEMITRHLTEPYVGLAADAVKKLLQDCVKRVRETYLRSKSKELTSSLRGAGPVNSAEQLEQIMNIHKSRRSLNRNS